MMIFKSSFSVCVGTLLLTAVCVKSKTHEISEDGTLIHELIARVSALEERDATQQKLIVDLQNELSNQKKDIGRMKQSLAARDRRIWSLLRSRRLQGGSDNAEMHTETSVKDHPSEEEGQATRRIRQTENEITVAFSAAFGKTMSHVGINQNIIFDHVFTNLGNGYNVHQGVFIAPVSGMYVFYMKIHGFTFDIWCHFVVNGIGKSQAYAHADSETEDASSQLIILHLQRGDDVSVQLLQNVIEMRGSGHWYTSFSGFLLKQDISQPGHIVG